MTAIKENTTPQLNKLTCLYFSAQKKPSSFAGHMIRKWVEGLGDMCGQESQQANRLSVLHFTAKKTTLKLFCSLYLTAGVKETPLVSNAGGNQFLKIFYTCTSLNWCSEV